MSSLLILSVLTLCPSATDASPAFRPPAVPLVAHDPYFSVWSCDNNLTDGWARHWTGKINALCGLARIDGKPYRFAGPNPKDVPPMEQRALKVDATRTVYTFDTETVKLQVTFLSPLLPDDLDLLSRPATYVTFLAVSKDGADHAVQIYLDITGEWCVNEPKQEVQWGRIGFDGGRAVRMGTTEQPVLAKKGDDLRIDWGYVCLAVPTQEGISTRMAGADKSRDTFAREGKAVEDDNRQPRRANDDWPVLAALFDLGKVGKDRPTST